MPRFKDFGKRKKIKKHLFLKGLLVRKTNRVVMVNNNRLNVLVDPNVEEVRERRIRVVLNLEIMTQYLKDVHKIEKFPSGKVGLTSAERKKTLRSSKIRTLLYNKKAHISSNIIQKGVNKEIDQVLMKKIAKKFDFEAFQNKPHNSEKLRWLSCEFDAIFYSDNKVIVIIELKSVNASSFARIVNKTHTLLIKGTEYYLQTQIQLRVAKLKYGIVLFRVSNTECVECELVPIMVVADIDTFNNRSERIINGYLSIIIPTGLINRRRYNKNRTTVDERKVILDHLKKKSSIVQNMNMNVFEDKDFKDNLTEATNVLDFINTIN